MTMPANNGKPALLFRFSALFWCLLLLFAGCAYFNTLYNANKLYKEAQEAPKAKDGSVNRAVEDKYDKVIEKCEMVITTHPNSKYVDDAILLMGKCLYEQGEYEAAIVKFEELKVNFPDSKLNREGQLYAAKSYIAEEDLESAVETLSALVEENPKGKAADEILFLLGTSLIKIGREDDAVQYLEMLATHHKRSPYRVSADLEAANLYAERGEYEKSLDLYRGLRNVQLDEADTIRFLSRLAKLYSDMGDYEMALGVFDELDGFVLEPTEKAANMLVLGQAYEGIDSLSLAIDTYRSITATYRRSMFSAEAYFHLGVVYQDELDSLEVAKAQFDNVPAQYAGSPFAEEAISRSVSISRLIRLRSSLEEGGEGDKVAVLFDLAETQLLQLNDYDEALQGYRKVLDEYPESDLAPKAAYAIAYIYDFHFEDRDTAEEAYEYLIDRYPASQQAEYARKALGLEPLLQPDMELEGPPEPLPQPKIELEGPPEPLPQPNTEPEGPPEPEPDQPQGGEQEQDQKQGQEDDQEQDEEQGQER